MNKLTTNNIDLYYNDIGNGYPVVLIHGLGSDHTVWEGMIPLLKENYRVLAVDLRGHGSSSKPAGPYTIELFAHDIYKFLEIMNIHQAHFIGHSMGGAVLQQLALQYPMKVRSLTLISSFAHVDSHLREVLLELLKILNNEGYSAFFDQALKLTNTPEFIEENKDFFRRVRDTMAETVSLPALKESINACLRVNLIDSIKSILIPTLIIEGSADVFTPPGHGKQMKNAIPNSHIEIIDGTSHNLLVEVPYDTYLIFLNFIKGL